MITPQKISFMLVGCGALILNLGIWRGDSSIEDYMELHKSQGVLEDTVQNLESENASLNQEIMKLKDSPNYAKKILRDKYHITEQDENIIFFVE